MTTKPNPNNFCGGAYQDWLEVNLTNACNAKCAWCVEKHGWHPTEKASPERIAVTYVNEEDSVGDYACCGNVSYAKHKDDCQLMKAKRLANKIKSQL